MISLNKEKFTLPKWVIGNVIITLGVLISIGYNIWIGGPKTQSFKVVDKIQGMSSTNSKPVFGTYIKYVGNINGVSHYEFVENPIIAKDIVVGSSYFVERGGIAVVSGIPWIMIIVGFVFGNLFCVFIGNIDD